MITMDMRKRWIRSAMGMAAIGNSILIYAILMSKSWGGFVASGTSCIAIAFLIVLSAFYLSGEPIQTRNGEKLTKDRNPIAYRFIFGLLSLFGIFPLLMSLLSIIFK
jgi:hypothetical protein